MRRTKKRLTYNLCIIFTSLFSYHSCPVPTRICNKLVKKMQRTKKKAHWHVGIEVSWNSQHGDGFCWSINTTLEIINTSRTPESTLRCRFRKVQKWVDFYPQGFAQFSSACQFRPLTWAILIRKPDLAY